MAASQRNPSDGPTMAESFNILYFLIRAYTLCFLVFLRKGMGREEPGFPGLAALIMMVGIGAFGRSTEMLIFAVFWLICLMVRRLETMRLVSQGVRLHSRFPGTPDLAMRLHLGKDLYTMVNAGEPMLVLVLGMVGAIGINETLGGFMIVGSVSMILRNLIERTVMTKRAIAMEDARIEQEELARMHKEGHY